MQYVLLPESSTQLELIKTQVVLALQMSHSLQEGKIFSKYQPVQILQNLQYARQNVQQLGNHGSLCLNLNHSELNL